MVYYVVYSWASVLTNVHNCSHTSRASGSAGDEAIDPCAIVVLDVTGGAREVLSQLVGSTPGGNDHN